MNKCAYYGTISKKKCVGYLCWNDNSEFLVEIDGEIILSTKISEDNGTTINFTSEDKKNAYGKIFIEGQGKKLNKASRVEIFNYKGI